MNMNSIHRNSSYRQLSESEICIMQAQGCEADDWGNIRVCPDFRAEGIRQVRFEGRVYLGADVRLERVAHLSGGEQTRFANGERIAVLKEDGGLEIPIYDHLTAMEADLLVRYSQDEALRAVLCERIETYAAQRECDGTVIESGVVVRDVRRLHNVRLTAGTTVEGATRLVEVSTVSDPAHLTLIGDDVILDHCIVGSDTQVIDGAQMDHCFVGQGCHIGRMFSATQSIFFANCHAENGEACALLAGPYSVTHHKSTLLIGAAISFFNAGSGSNQSNHSYKLGPNKWGRLGRGSKLGSSSYLFWPFRTGAFTTVIGHHTAHADLSDLPFSLVLESAGRTVIVPAKNLASVGTWRDVAKWPKRDHRGHRTPASGEGFDPRRDLIQFSMLNPYTVGQISRAIVRLMQLVDGGEPQPVAGQREETLFYEYADCLIAADSLHKALIAYQQAIELYLFEQVQARLTASLPLMAEEIGTGLWQDYGGLIAPEVETLALVREGISFAQIEPHLAAWEWNWAAALFTDFYGKPPYAMTEYELAALLENGARIERHRRALLYADAVRDLKAADPAARPEEDPTCRALAPE